MSWSLVEALIASIALIVISILISRIASRTHYNRQIKQSKQYLPEIDRFFTELAELSSKHISQEEEYSFTRRWLAFHSALKAKGFYTTIPDYDRIANFLDTYSNLHSVISDRNEELLLQEIQRNDSFLSDIDGKSLDMQQRSVVVSDNDRTLVLAGAGSGKTLTIAAKVKYLCEVKHVSPEDILLISFTNKSAAEMSYRIMNRLGIPVEATTFHKLGLDIITKRLGFRPEVSDDLPGFVQDFFETRLLNHSEWTALIAEYFAYYLDIPEALEDCTSLGELYDKEKSKDLETLKSKYEREKFIQEVGIENAKSLNTLQGEQVKSIEETKIANFLFLNGVRYEYERPYPFENDDNNRKTYRPDFYLRDYDIYLEHFGITRDYKCPWLSDVEEEKYLEGIRWKRETHTQHNTKLIETYSYYASEGSLFTELKTLLVNNGVELQKPDFIDVFNTIYAKKTNKYFSEFIKLCCTFLTLFKSNNYKHEHFKQLKAEAILIKNDFMRRRTFLFLEITRVLFEEYQRHLTANNSIDFSDMINDAATKVEVGNTVPHYRYVIVDEYQDISQSRFSLLKSIVTATNAKLLCVGDDWQSIYRFAGSEVSLFTNFEKYFGEANILRIERTYRNSQELINEASAFILRNPSQLRKNLISEKHLDYPLVFWGYDKEPYTALKQVMQKIISEFGPDRSILLLGRNGYDLQILNDSGLFSKSKGNRVEKLTYLPSPQTPVTFLSVHKSKGLEADNVVILNFRNETLGFPNQISDDRILNLVLPEGENYAFAEERRLFYVAVTRTKNRTFVLTDNNSPSIFFREFSESRSCCFVHIRKPEKEAAPLCPRCRTGRLYVVENNGKTFVGCSNHPKCKYKLNDLSILTNPRKCLICGGFLVKRKDRNNHWFLGCTNYPYCRNTKPLKQKSEYQKF